MVETDNSEDEENIGGNGMLRLPYAIAKSRGIDTTGLTPSQVWAKLKGEGVSPAKEIYEFKKRQDTPAEIKRAEELGIGGDIHKKLRDKKIYTTGMGGGDSGLYRDTNKELIDENLKFLGDLADKYSVGGEGDYITYPLK